MNKYEEELAKLKEEVWSAARGTVRSASDVAIGSARTARNAKDNELQEQIKLVLERL